jgi:putative transposase
MKNQADLPVRTMCRVLGVFASGFYAWRDRAPSQSSIANAVMTERIRQIHQDSCESYGMPRVRAELIEQGVCISKRRGFTVTTRRDKREPPAHNLVNRRFYATGPNQRGPPVAIRQRLLRPSHS